MTSRLRRRLVAHHLPIGLATLAAGFLLYITRSFPDVITRLSFASAWPALILMAAALLIGPYRVLTGRNAAASIDLRRDLGIWAGIAGLFHFGFGQFEHLRGRPWLYYVYGENWQETHLAPVRYDIFGFSNHTGLIAVLILLALLATSNDVSLRKLGTPGWKQLQRWNYACFGLTAAHTFGYLLGVKRPDMAWLSVAFAAILVTLTLQLIGYRRRQVVAAAR